MVGLLNCSWMVTPPHLLAEDMFLTIAQASCAVVQLALSPGGRRDQLPGGVVGRRCDRECQDCPRVTCVAGDGQDLDALSADCELIEFGAWTGSMMRPGRAVLQGSPVIAPLRLARSSLTASAVKWLRRCCLGRGCTRSMACQAFASSVVICRPSSAELPCSVPIKVAGAPKRRESRVITSEAIARLGPAPQGRAQALGALLSLLASDQRNTRNLADAAVRLAVTSQDKARARETLLGRLGLLARTLSPAVTDLRGTRNWPYPPAPKLLAAARQNSALSAWLWPCHGSLNPVRRFERDEPRGCSGVFAVSRPRPVRGVPAQFSP
jgi:hypothetical protein